MARAAALVALPLVFLTTALSIADEPESFELFPGTAHLEGSRARQRLIATVVEGGAFRDVSREVRYASSEPAVAEVDASGIVWARQDGTTTVTASLKGFEASVEILVDGTGKTTPVSFRHEVLALFARNGCNSGACHGAPNGKNGFRLSLRGYDPSIDYRTLTGEAFSRRVNRTQPDASLFLEKALGLVPHGGGKRVSLGSRDYRMLRAWVEEGLHDDVTVVSPPLRLEVYPQDRMLRPSAALQQLAVTAVFPDGTRRDVTDLSVYTTNDEELAEVSSGGLVRCRKEDGQGSEVAILVRYLGQLGTTRITFLPSIPVRAEYPEKKNFIDGYVFDKLKMLGIPPGEACTDSDFIRRVYLDTIAMLPEPDEVRRFLADSSPLKRTRLIDTLLERDEFDDFWTLKWLDVFRSNRKAIGLRAAHHFQRWVHHALSTRMSLDSMAREVLTATGDLSRNPAGNFYRVTPNPLQNAEAVSQLFLGVRLGCAQCHNHPFERWTQDDYYGLAAFFAEVRIKGPRPRQRPNNSTDFQALWLDQDAKPVKHPLTDEAVSPRFIGGGKVETADGEHRVDRRVLLADWLTSPENPFFARALANRIWYHIFGRGVVDPVDDFRESNPPSNEQLLVALAKELVRGDYDLRHLVRTILCSNTYQRSYRVESAKSTSGRVANEKALKYFSHAEPRILGAEQLLDALCQVTGVPEKYAGLPPGTRAVERPDSFVENKVLKAFGQPDRDFACECERESESTIAQALEMIGGKIMNEKLREPQNRIGKLVEAGSSDVEIVEQLYLAAFARLPLPKELKVASDYIASAKDRRLVFEDLLWSLLNTQEFLFRR